MRQHNCLLDNRFQMIIDVWSRAIVTNRLSDEKFTADSQH